MADAVAAVRKAARAERAAEKARSESERDWRSAWWVTSNALAAVPATPRDQLVASIDIVVETTGASRTWINLRRQCGKWSGVLEYAQQTALIPRFAIAAMQAKADPETAAELILQAEHEGCSLREFSGMLTGRSWTNAPENMTDAERLHVARTELKRRPAEVLEDEEVAEAVAEADRAKHVSRAGLAHMAEENEARLHNFDRNASKRFGLPEVPIQHLDGALREIVAGIAAVDIHGLENEADWDDHCDRIIQAGTTAKKKPHTKGVDTWSPEDQALLDDLTRGS